MNFFYKLISFDVIISLFWSIIHSSDKFAFLNCFFIIGMIYLLFGGICFVWEKGFFNITLFSYNKLNHDLQKKRGILIEGEPDIDISDYVYRENYFEKTNDLLYSGLVISTFSIVFSFICL